MFKKLLVTLLSLSSVLSAADFSISEEAGKTITVAYESKALVKLMIENDKEKKAHETYKVFLHVMDASGQETLTKGAGDKFTHHRGIYIGWSKTKIQGQSYDTWHMKKDVRQEFQKLISKDITADMAKFTVAINWVAGDTILLTEERTFTIHKPMADGALLIDKESKITAVLGDADLGGDPEHAGCHFRAHSNVHKNNSARFIFPDGKLEQKAVQAKRDMPWAAMTFKSADKDYFVQHMSHSSLPKGWRHSAYRSYGRFGSFWVTDIKKDQTKTFKLRFYISPGTFPESIIDDSNKRYTEYVK